MGEDKRRERRVPAELRIRLGYGSIDEFIERYALNISRGGIFVRTLEPKPVGTEVTLDIAIDSGDRVVRGKGVVAWTAAPSAPGEATHEPGMGIKFTELDAESRALVDLVVATRGGSARSDEPPGPEEVDVDLLDFFEDDEEAAPTATATASPTSPSPSPLIPSVGPEARSRGTTSPSPSPLIPSVGPEARSRGTTATASPTSPSPSPLIPSVGPEARSRGTTATSTPKPATPKPARKKGPVVGIDLGTTNSCVAFVRNGRAEVLASRQGYRTLPSVVAYDAQGRLLVGQPAKAQMIVNPRNTVYGSKRLVGRPFASPTVQACRDRFHYDIVEGEGGTAAVRFAGRVFSLQQVAALVLTELREVASQALGAPVERAVITVPAYYNDHQRNAVREAGRLAGLEVDRIVNEPTAAALAFGHGKNLDQRVLVYDLGGGTFDASVLEIQNDVYQVVSTGGDTFLGGVDFDGQLVDHLVWTFMQKHGFAPPDDRVVWQRIRDAAEETKVALSSRDAAVAHVPFLCKSPRGEDVELKVAVTREELEELTGRLVERTLEVCAEVLRAKGLGPGDVQQILLVGGQSRMPLVWRRIREAFGREPNKAVHPDEAVAIGAALLADSAERIDSVVLIDALAMGIGVGLPGGRMAPILPRNTSLPAKKTYELATTRDGQTELELQVFQGDSPRVAECEYLGTVRLADLPPRPRGQVKVAIEFALGAEGILAVTARDLATGKSTELRLATHDTPESLRQKLQIPEPAQAPPGARPIDPERRAAAAPPAGPAAPGAPAPARKGLFGRLFGARR